ncbi:MAG: TonB-dependent receptor [Methylobacillus sp.]|jgi:iron complex outermembrane receptor protein|nr:TonB-dependent receptor [Methylobacillus sp.]
MSRPVFSRIPLCAALIFAYPAFAAEEVSAPPVTVAEPLLFPSPIGMTADDADFARRRSSTGDTASLFSETPGVSLIGAGGVSSLPSIHGLADDRIRIKVDGMDFISACVNHMNPPLSYIAPANVAEAQVYAGITPVSLGGDSIAGTLLVNSAAPEFSTDETLLTKGQISTFYRSNNHARGVNLSAMFADDQVSVRYTGSAVKAGNAEAARNFKPAGKAAARRGWLAGDEIGSTAYEAQNHALDIAFKHENHLLDLKLGLQHIPYQGFPNQRMDMTNNDSRQINLRYVGQFDWGNLEAAIFNEHTRHSMQFGDDKRYWYGAAFNVAGMPMDTEGRNTGVTLKADVLLSESDTLRVGTEYRRYRLDDWWSPVANSGMGPNTFWNIRNGQRDRYAAYTEWESRWNKEWTTLIGLRHETVKMNTGAIQGYSAGYGNPNNPATIPGAFNASDRSKTDHNLDFTVLTRFTPDAEKTFEAGYAIKTRSPNLYERYVWSNNNSMVMNMNNWVGDGNGYVGNPDLKPETAHTVSLAAKWQDAENSAWNLRVAPYYSYVRDYIDAAPCTQIYATCPTRGDGFVNLSLANQNARLYGVDISGRLALGSVDSLGAFSATGLLNVTRGKNITTGDDLYNIMPTNATLALEHRLGNWSNRLETKMVSAKTRVQATRKELQTGGYALLNFTSSYAWKQVRLDFGIENLLDKHYANPLGGAYLGQGDTMASGATAPQHGTSVPGWGRSINTSVTVMF